MCRDGFNVECETPGCTNRVTCRHELGMCPQHGMESNWVKEDREPVLWAGDNS